MSDLVQTPTTIAENAEKMAQQALARIAELEKRIAKLEASKAVASETTKKKK